MRRRRVVHGDHIYVPGLPGLRRPEACGEDLPFYVPHLRHGGLSGPFCRSLDRHLLRPGKTDPADRLLRHGLRDMALIFTAEYVTGSSSAPLGPAPGITPLPVQRGRLIRLDFAPLWFVAGLLFERITQGK